MKMIDKVKQVFRLKNSMIKALQGDLVHALKIIEARDRLIQDLQAQLVIMEQERWMQQDADQKWIDEMVARMEAEERGEDMVSIDVGLQFDPDRELEIDKELEGIDLTPGGTD